MDLNHTELVLTHVHNMSIENIEIDPKIVVKEKDLNNEDIEKYILQLVSKSMTNFNFETTTEIDIARSLKIDLDDYNKRENIGGYWCVVVGRNFGSYMSYEKGYFIHLMYLNISFQIFKVA